jgi:hypothetical protein
MSNPDSTPSAAPAAAAGSSSPGTKPATPDWYARRVEVMATAMREWGPSSASNPCACDPFQGVLPSSISSMMEARQAFTEEAQSFVRTTLLMFSAAGALLVVPYTQNGGAFPRDVVCHGLAAVCLWMVWPVTSIMMKTAEAGYELYVANATYSAIAHRAAGIGTVPDVRPDDTTSLSKMDFEQIMRDTTDLPHSWLDGVERSRNRAVYFTDLEQSRLSRAIDFLRGWPPIINLWGSRTAWPSNHDESRGKTLRVAEDPREVHTVYTTSAQTLLHSLQQTQAVARGAATLGAIGLMAWTFADVLPNKKIPEIALSTAPWWLAGVSILVWAAVILLRALVIAIRRP